MTRKPTYEELKQRVSELEKAVSSHKRMEEELKETRNYLNNLIDYANVPVIVWNPDFKVTRYNIAFERLTGKSAGEVIDKPLDILFPEFKREETMAFVRRTTAKKK